MGTMHGHCLLFWTYQETPHNMATRILSHKPFKLDEQDMLDSAGDVRTNLKVTFTCGPQNMNTPMLADHHISTSFMRTHDEPPRWMNNKNCHEELARVINDRNTWGERSKWIFAISMTWWWWWWWNKIMMMMMMMIQNHVIIPEQKCCRGI